MPERHGYTRDDDDGVAIITLNDGGMNTLNLELLEDLSRDIDAIRADDAIRVLVLTGEGRAFSAGGDMPMLKRASADPGLIVKLGEVGHRVSIGLELLEKPVLCAVNGVAAGGGVDLALACDLRIATRDARFVMTFTRIGLMPDLGGTYRLPRLVGVAKAKELIFLGHPVGADQALELGLVNALVDASELMSFTMDWARTLASERAPRALAAAKVMINQAPTTDLVTALRNERFAAQLLTRSNDFSEGVSAFIEKRAPEFNGD